MSNWEKTNLAILAAALFGFAVGCVLWFVPCEPRGILAARVKVLENSGWGQHKWNGSVNVDLIRLTQDVHDLQQRVDELETPTQVINLDGTPYVEAVK